MTKELKFVARKLFVLYSPWPSWRTSGYYIVGDSNASATERITATDEAGREILSYVPVPFEGDFLSNAGQSLVSRPKPRYISPY
jgi:hypothetical protein